MARRTIHQENPAYGFAVERNEEDGGFVISQDDQLGGDAEAIFLTEYEASLLLMALKAELEKGA